MQNSGYLEFGRVVENLIYMGLENSQAREGACKPSNQLDINSNIKEYLSRKAGPL